MNYPLITFLVYALVLLLLLRQHLKAIAHYQTCLHISDDAEGRLRGQSNLLSIKLAKTTEQHARLLGDNAQLRALNEKLKAELRRRHRRLRV